MTSKGATRNETTNNGLHSKMLKIYSAEAPNQVDIIALEHVKEPNNSAVALQVADLLYNITQQLYPPMTTFEGVAQPFVSKKGISLESWSVLFIGILIGVVFVMYVIDWIWVDTVSKTDVLTLIENATDASVLARQRNKKNRMKKRTHASWSLEKNINQEYRVLLRGQRIGGKRPTLWTRFSCDFSHMFPILLK